MQDWKTQAAPLLVVDVETTGLDPDSCALIEIGAVSLADPSVEFHRCCAAFHDAKIDELALRVNGRSRESVSCWTSPYTDESTAIVEFLNWVQFTFDDQRMILAGMNPGFDLGFLRAAARRALVKDSRFRRIFSHRTLDLHTLAVQEMIRYGADEIDKLHTDAIYEMLEMEPEPHPHSGITGARMEARAFTRLLKL